MMQGGDYEQPVMQVLGIKKVVTGGTDKQRHRILLSDGRHSVSFAMLTTQLLEKVGPVTPMTVVRVQRFITSVVNNSGKGDQ